MTDYLDGIERFSDEWYSLTMLRLVTPKRFWPALEIPADSITNDPALVGRHAPAVVKQLQQWLAHYTPEDGSSLLLMGATGTGKTYLGYRMLRYMFDMQPNVASLQPPHNVNADAEDLMLKGRRASGSISQEKFEIEYLRPELLFIDDLGVAKTSEATETEMSSLVDYRYAHLLSTVVTTNVPTDELLDRLGDRVVDRLREAYEFVILDGESRR